MGSGDDIVINIDCVDTDMIRKPTKYAIIGIDGVDNDMIGALAKDAIIMPPSCGW